MKQQRIERTKPRTAPSIIDERQPKVQTLPTSNTSNDLPLRTVYYVEVGTMDQLHVQELVKRLGDANESLKGGMHYVVPVRNGRIGSDIIFEHEILEMVRKVCEVNSDGEIILKDGATECQIVRERIE